METEIFTDKTIKLWQLSERLREREQRRQIKDPSWTTSLRVRLKDCNNIQHILSE